MVYLGGNLRQYLGKIELVTILVSKRGLCRAHRGDRNSKTGQIGLGPKSCSVSRGATESCKSHRSHRDLRARKEGLR